MLTAVFAIAAVYHTSVFVVRVPNLRAEKAAAVTALYLVGEYRHSAVVRTVYPFSAFKLCLYHVKNLWADDSFVIVFNVVLRYLSFVFYQFFRQIINSELLLELLHTMDKNSANLKMPKKWLVMRFSGISTVE